MCKSHNRPTTATRAAGIKAVDPDSFRKLPPLQAVKALLKEQALLEKKLASGKVGKILSDLEETRQGLPFSCYREWPPAFKTFTESKQLLIKRGAAKRPPQARFIVSEMLTKKVN